ncbi:hypothetical protein BDR26DRAFT_347445 [Obelidium mucronatum]|nr:hypothetical protein BDR26DRAFT_347445 [Obelidium mucronatum]
MQIPVDIIIIRGYRTLNEVGLTHEVAATVDQYMSLQSLFEETFERCHYKACDWKLDCALFYEKDFKGNPKAIYEFQTSIGAAVKRLGREFIKFAVEHVEKASTTPVQGQTAVIHPKSTNKENETDSTPGGSSANSSAPSSQSKNAPMSHRPAGNKRSSKEPPPSKRRNVPPSTQINLPIPGLASGAMRIEKTNPEYDTTSLSNDMFALLTGGTLTTVQSGYGQ